MIFATAILFLSQTSIGHLFHVPLMSICLWCFCILHFIVLYKLQWGFFLKAKTFSFCPKEWKMFNFCVQMIKYSTVLLKSNPSIAQCTIMHIDVHNNLCSKTISIASMVCEMSLKLWIIFPFHSKKFIPISTSRSPRVRIVLELRIFFFYNNYMCKDIFLSKNYSNIFFL